MAIRARMAAQEAAAEAVDKHRSSALVTAAPAGAAVREDAVEQAASPERGEAHRLRSFSFARLASKPRARASHPGKAETVVPAGKAEGVVPVATAAAAAMAGLRFPAVERADKAKAERVEKAAMVVSAATVAEGPAAPRFPSTAWIRFFPRPATH